MGGKSPARPGLRRHEGPRVQQVGGPWTTWSPWSATTYRRRRGWKALRVALERADPTPRSSRQIWGPACAPPSNQGASAVATGRRHQRLTQGDTPEAAYELPLAHAPMEPMNCTVRLTPAPQNLDRHPGDSPRPVKEVAGAAGEDRPVPAAPRRVSVQPSFAASSPRWSRPRDEQGEVHSRRDIGRRCRHRGQSGHGRRAAPGRPGVRTDRRPLRRDHPRQGRRVQQSNFRLITACCAWTRSPRSRCMIKSGEAPGGIGETGTTAGPPALRNAVYAATDRPQGAFLLTAAPWLGARRHEGPHPSWRQ